MNMELTLVELVIVLNAVFVTAAILGAIWFVYAIVQVVRGGSNE